MPQPDDHPFGPDLARRTADLLEAGGQVGEIHPRLYSGYCLLRRAGAFLVAEVQEGEVVAREAAFRRRAEFEAWLAAQSDAALARFDNPAANRRWSLSRARIEAALGPSNSGTI